MTITEEYNSLIKLQPEIEKLISEEIDKDVHLKELIRSSDPLIDVKRFEQSFINATSLGTEGLVNQLRYALTRKELSSENYRSAKNLVLVIRYLTMNSQMKNELRKRVVNATFEGFEGLSKNTLLNFKDYLDAPRFEANCKAIIVYVNKCKNRMEVIDDKDKDDESDDVSYFKRMEKIGKRLKQKEAFILDVIRINLRKNGFHIKNLIAGERKLTENIYEKLKDVDLAIKERKEFMKSKKQNFNNNSFKPWTKKETQKYNTKEVNKSVNNIDAEEIINKENHIYINDLKFRVLLDSEAEDNYMSETVANQIKRNIQTYDNPKVRYTCIKTSFYIKNYVLTKFIYKGKEEQARFDILPNRKDEFIIIGRQFMVNLTKDNSVNTATGENEIEELLEKLCNRQVTEEIDYKCHIPTRPGDVATGGTYFISYAEEKQINEEISRLLKLGYIRPSTSMWLNKLKPVIKPNGTLRITLNLIKLNQLVSIDRYSLPNMEEMIYKLNGQKIFSKIDLKEGFFQIPLAEEDRHKTAFRVKNKLYEWTRMPMGFKNSSAVFQRYMDGILGTKLANRVLFM